MQNKCSGGNGGHGCVGDHSLFTRPSGKRGLKEEGEVGQVTIGRLEVPSSGSHVGTHGHWMARRN